MNETQVDAKISQADIVKIKSKERQRLHEAWLTFFILAIFVLSMQATTGDVSAQTLGETDYYCIVDFSDSDWDTQRNSETGQITRFKLTTITITCDPDLTRGPIELVVNVPQYESSSEASELVNDAYYQKVADNDLTIVGDESEVNRNYNCHSFVFQKLQEQFGFELQVEDIHWDDNGAIDIFSYFFMDQIYEGPTDLSSDELILEIGDVVFFYPYEGGFHVHSGIVVGLSPEGEPIIRGKLGELHVVDGSIQGMAGYYDATYVKVQRLDQEFSFGSN